MRIGSDGSGKPALPTRPRSHHPPDPKYKRGVVHCNSVKVSQARLLEFLGVVEDLAGVPDCFARLGVLGPGADLRVDSTGFVFACAAGEELDIVEGDVEGHHEEFEDEGDFGWG